MQVIGDKNQIYEDVFNFMISYLPFPQKSIRSELAKLFSIIIVTIPRNMNNPNSLPFISSIMYGVGPCGVSISFALKEK